MRTPILRRLTPFSGKESSTASPLIGPATSAGELACSLACSRASLFRARRTTPSEDVQER